MEQYFLNSKWLLLHFLHCFHLLSLTSGAGFESQLINSDELALLDFKKRITHDPLHITSSWNSSLHFCNWTGVTCSPTNGRVIILNLESRQLVGSLPSSIGNLTFLTDINLYNNSFLGEVPQAIGRLQHLQYLNLTHNYVGGSIPINLSRCTGLRVFEASYNEFIGTIPDQLSSLSKLLTLGLASNNITGRIPAWIGNLSSLQFLTLGFNNLEGSIPKEIGLLSGLGYFRLSGNHLSGTIPSSIYNISSMYFFSAVQNQLHGQLPSDVGLKLPNLQAFIGGINNFTGSIPSSLSNASNLEVIDFSGNGLTGNVPESFGRLKGLVKLNFARNRLGNGEIGELNFLNFLANCTSLRVLGLNTNRFGGELPNSIGNLSSQLQRITMGSNMIHGNIPLGIGNLVNLSALGLEKNYLTGSIPDVIGRLQNLELLSLRANRLSGSIPPSLGNLTKLNTLVLQENKFEGSIPPSLGNCQKLNILALSSNKLNGTIPREVIGLSSLSIYLAMSNNLLTGSLPLEVSNLKNLEELDVSDNKLSGEIPSSLGSCTSLERLYLRGNTFDGAIPQSLKNLRGLEELDLSQNNLSGQIPEFLSKISSLKYLNLSYNELDGEVPREGIFTNASDISLVGNAKICGGVSELHLPVCSRKDQGKFFNHKVVISITIAIIVAIILPSVFLVYYIVNSSRRNSNKPSIELQLGLSYSEILKSTNNFSEENLIGLGSFGSVYKGVLPGDGKIVAIKVLLQQQRASRSFIDECDVLRSIRHRNILKIITICSSVDFEGNDFKCLVFEFMPNGTLDKWLHQTTEEQSQIKKLSLLQRLNIAIDIASAFDYLHHNCETPIVHCDLKPSNVLLDEDMTALVGDFGLARFLFEESNNPSENQIMSSVGLRGSIGYIPPEYMSGQVSMLGDIYSYGILLLEMFTGKRPTDDMFKDDLSIHKFVSMALPDHIMDIVDPSMFFEEQNEDELEDCLVSVIRIGLMCSTSSPRERMAMNNVVNNLKKIRDSFLKSKVRKTGRRR